jgi:hypothetical protein
MFCALMLPVNAAVVPRAMQFDVELDTPSVPVMCPFASVWSIPPIKIRLGLNVCEVALKPKFPFIATGVNAIGAVFIELPPQETKASMPRQPKRTNTGFFMRTSFPYKLGL